MAISYIVFHFVILSHTRYNSRSVTYKNKLLKSLNYSFVLIQFVFASLIILLIFEIVTISSFSTSLLTVGSTISYVLAGIVAGILSQRLFSWYYSNHSFIVLSYGITSIMIVISMGFTIVYNDVSLLNLPLQRDPTSQVIINFYPSDSPMGIVQYVWAMSNAITYFMLWIGTVTLLRNQSKKVGKLKLWIIFCIPLVSLIYQYVFAANLTEVLQSISNASSDSIFLSIVGNTMPGIIFGIMFGVPFWIVSRTLPSGSLLRYNMNIAAFGLVLMQLAATAGVYGAPYPPFGLISVLTTALSAYLILVGIYHSAVSIAIDSKIRLWIRRYTMNEAELFDSIGTSHMLQELEKRVVDASKKGSDILMSETGIVPPLSDDDVKKYVHEVIDEITKSKTS